MQIYPLVFTFSGNTWRLKSWNMDWRQQMDWKTLFIIKLQHQINKITETHLKALETLKTLDNFYIPLIWIYVPLFINKKNFFKVCLVYSIQVCLVYCILFKSVLSIVFYSSLSCLLYSIQVCLVYCILFKSVMSILFKSVMSILFKSVMSILFKSVLSIVFYSSLSCLLYSIQVCLVYCILFKSVLSIVFYSSLSCLLYSIQVCHVYSIKPNIYINKKLLPKYTQKCIQFLLGNIIILSNGYSNQSWNLWQDCLHFI